MTTYTIKHTDGSRSTKHDTMDDARAELRRVYGDDIEIGDEEQNGDIEMRRLVWASEEEAEGDDGAHAVASIRWTS